MGNDSKGKQRRQILSKGKGMPVPPQGAVVTNVLFPKGEMEARKRLVGELTIEGEANLLAPFGSAECFIVKQGELVFQIVSGSDITYNQPHTGHANAVSDIYGKGCVNGLRRGTQLRCVGWSATDNDTTNDSTDNLGAVQTTGTCTVINTGPNMIPNMSEVLFDEEPYTLLDAKGRRIPGVLEIGQPGSEHRSNLNCKFVPALYFLTDSNVPTMLACAVDELYNQIAALNADDKKSRMGKVAAFFEGFKDGKTTIGELEDIVINVAKEKGPPSIPLKEYLLVSIAYLMIESVDVMCEMIREKVLPRLRKERKAANTAIGEDDDTMGAYFGVFDKKPQKPKNLNEHGDELSDDEDDEGGEDTNVLLSLFKLRDHLVCDVGSWIKSHSIGIAFNNAEAGAPLNLLLRYYHI